ncbi:GH25 family lysozyme [Sphingosinithalassobacter sp. CS137]|uniref:GH25 family lysozyme n=1 Tax=Sphingosinithalassobacter sp. CS137 TaxID=2762748 RepID=UPI00165DC29B|nr:GH25 family lysozyme [Sphingosinithalassobacter sp. CS137]
MVPPRILARRLRILAGITLALALIALVAALAAVTWRPPFAQYPVQGIDVRESHGRIDWFTLRAHGVRFAYARATLGAERRDTRFAEYWRGMYEAGIPRGAIHVFSMCRLAADQVRNFVTTVRPTPEQLPPAVELDFQPDCPARPDRAVLVNEVRILLAGVEGHLGRRAILKIPHDFERAYRVSEAVRRPLWAIQPLAPPNYLARPWTLWQTSSFRRIDGMHEPVNWNVLAP